MNEVWGRENYNYSETDVQTGILVNGTVCTSVSL